MQCEKAAPVAIAEAFNMIVAFCYQYFAFHMAIGWKSALGALLIGLAVVSIALKKWCDVRREAKQEVVKV